MLDAGAPGAPGARGRGAGGADANTSPRSPPSTCRIWWSSCRTGNCWRGLRYDCPDDGYDTVSVSTTPPGPQAQACYAMKVSEVSKRLSRLYQPQRVSIPIGGGTPFNTWEVDGCRCNVPRRPDSKRWC